MKKELFDEEVKRIEVLYSNLFLLAINRHYNLRRVVNEIAHKIDRYFDDIKDYTRPRGMDGVLFVSAVAKSLGTSLTEASYLGESEKKYAVYRIVRSIDPMDIMFSDYNSDKDKDIITVQYLYKYKDVCGSDAFYNLKFDKIPDEEGTYNYNIEAQMTKNGKELGLETDLIPEKVTIWKEKNGDVADFVEEVIANVKRIDKECKVPAFEVVSNKPTSNDLELHEVVKKKIIVENKKNKESRVRNNNKIVNELRINIYNDTKSVTLLDKFEGYGENNPAYKRIVIQNTGYTWMINKKYVDLNLVIERSYSRNYVGDITFTDFKQNRDHNLRNFLRQEINDNIVENYLDGKIYRFKKPYHLRAQNSTNRTGYGWEWNWSRGVGEYTEGTLYGETTDYVFAGVYIKSRDFIYDEEERKPVRCINS